MTNQRRPWYTTVWFVRVAQLLGIAEMAGGLALLVVRHDGGAGLRTPGHWCRDVRLDALDQPLPIHVLIARGSEANGPGEKGSTPELASSAPAPLLELPWSERVSTVGHAHGADYAVT
jgi:hypothetical protein